MCGHLCGSAGQRGGLRSDVQVLHGRLFGSLSHDVVEFGARSCPAVPARSRRWSPWASAGVEVQVWLLLQLPTQLRHPLEESSEPDPSDQSSEHFTWTTNSPVRLL